MVVDWVQQSVVVFSLGETFKLLLVACSLEQEVLLFIANEKCLSFVVVIDPSIDGLMAVKMGDGRRTSLNSTHWTKKLTDGRRTDATKKQRDENKQRNAKQREKATHTTHITTHLAFDNEDYVQHKRESSTSVKIATVTVFTPSMLTPEQRPTSVLLELLALMLV